jgi:menaquinol-cytochrome c reductase iron-sulfur subunit
MRKSADEPSASAPRPDGAPTSASRRRALSWFVNGVVVFFGGALSALLGVFAVRPAASSPGDRWLKAGKVADLVPGTPVPRVLAVPSHDGWYRARSPETVFLVWDGARTVHAFSATCTHLGCQVHWNGDAQKFICPCHGGAYDSQGRVIEGPPPRSLDRVQARLDDSNTDVLVQL